MLLYTFYRKVGCHALEAFASSSEKRTGSCLFYETVERLAIWRPHSVAAREYESILLWRNAERMFFYENRW